MAIQTIDNLRDRSRSIVEEVRANSVDGPRLGNLLIDFVDTVEDLSNKINSKVDVTDVSLSMSIEEDESGKVADARLINRLRKKIDNCASMGWVMNALGIPPPIASLSNDDVFYHNNLHDIAMLRLTIRDINGVIYHTQFVGDESFAENSPKYQINVLVFDEEFNKDYLNISLQIKNGEKVKFHSDTLDVKLFVLDINHVF